MPPWAAATADPEFVFLSVGLSLLSNLVYPSVSALVARRVPPDGLGEALGAVNGVKALTEGLGPLVFAALMVEFEATSLPGTTCSVPSGHVIRTSST